MSAVPPPPPNVPPGGWSYGGVAREHPQGTTILVLGILSILCCGFLGPVAWIMGHNALTEIDRSPTSYSNRGLVQTGMILGIVGTVLWALGIILRLAVF